MKKMKLFLTAAVVISAVGVAVAAKNFNLGTHFCNSTSGSVCPTVKSYKTVTTGGVTAFCGASGSNTCISTSSATAEQEFVGE
jgi:hypothetical protein